MKNPILPKEIEAEIAILGCIFLDDNLMVSVEDEISYEDFYEIKNKEIYKAMSELHKDKKDIDITTLTSHLNAKDKLNVAGGVDYINSIFDFSYTVSNIDSYIELVKNASIKRKAIDLLSNLAQDGYSNDKSANDYLNEIEYQILELSKRKNTGSFEDVNDVLEKVKRNVEANAVAEKEITGIDTGFSNLNKVTLGLQKDALIILAARPAMGKSAFAMNLAVQAASNNKEGKAVCAIFSLEMSSDQLVERMVAADSMIHQTTIKKGRIIGREQVRFANSCDKLSKLNLYFDDSSYITVDDIRTKCRKLSAEKGLDLVIIDYLQLVKGDQTKAKHEEVAGISRGLKLMARELHVPVVALAQLSRNVEQRESKKPNMSDLRDSGSIEQDADVVMFLYREDYYNKNSPRVGEADLIISKNRSGSAGGELKFLFQGEYSKFVEIKEEENKNV